VLLLEIGLWSRVLDLKKKEFERAENAGQAFSILMRLIEADLPHATGTKYANIVAACLKGYEKGIEMNQMDFRRDVTNTLEELASFTGRMTGLPV
jgi:hypothetical protein